MSRKESKTSKVIRLIILLFLIGLLVVMYNFYQTRNFEDFTRAESNLGLSKFTRDDQVKYSKEKSFKIESSDFNDAIFYKEIDVIPNTAYRMSCMVKTDNIETVEEVSDAGAQIAIVQSTEQSVGIVGTNDWQRIECLFDSKNRNKISIGFRLGGNMDNAKGTAWFSDFRLEQGRKNIGDNGWNFGCFIFKNVDVNIKNKQGEDEHLKFTMSMDDISTMRDDMRRFKAGCEELSGGLMSVEYQIQEIDTPITSISYSDEHGYYVDPTDVKETLIPYVQENEYDHIFAVIRLGDNDINKEIPVRDWIGLRWNGFI